MRIRTLLATVAAVAAVGSLLWWLWGRAPAAPATVATPRPAVGEPTTAVVPPPPIAGVALRAPCAFQPGEGFVYRAELTTKNSVRPRALLAAVMGATARITEDKAPLSEHINSSARWDLHLRVVRLQPDGAALLAARYLGLHYEDGGAAAGQRPVGDTEPPFFVQVNRRCAIDKFGWRATADTTGARTQQALLALVDFALPEREGELEFRGSARDERGTYDYRAALIDVAGARLLTKRKEHYRGQPGLGGMNNVAERVTGDGLSVRLAAGQWYETALLSETRELGPGMELFAKSDISFASRKIGTAPMPIAADPDDGGWVWGDLLGVATASVRQAVDPKLAGLPLEAILAKVAAMAREDGSVSEALALLTAWIAANPGQIPAIGKWIRTQGVGTDADKQLTRRLMQALGSTGLPQARKLLRELALDKGFHTTLRVDAALNLATARNLDKDDLDALLAMSRERVDPRPEDPFATFAGTSGTALLGAAAKLLNEQGADLAQKAIEELEGRLASEKTPEYLKSAIIGAGNSGDPRLLKALAPIIAQGEPELRLEAAGALRLMPMEKTADIFAAWMAKETHDNVKQALVHSMWLNAGDGAKALAAPVVQTALSQFAAPQQDPVREELTHLLGVASKQDAAAKQALVAAFQAELAKGAKGNMELMQVIGQYIDAATLMGKAPPAP
ncbi:MAG: HEAT repeat domain-containing protein [Myxococcales bacterium]|nr:HEAT repeat domain-containing protein [Myxococcales bacterium]